MIRPNSELSPSQVKEILRQLRQQPDSGNKSKQIVVNVIRGANGEEYYVGGQLNSVEVTDQGLPITVQKQEAKRLQCGHIVTSVAEYGAICDEGHELCKRHELQYCDRCGAAICDFCDFREIGDELICSRHSFIRFISALFGG